MTCQDGFRLPKPAPLALALMLCEAPRRAVLDLPAALQMALAERPVVFDLEAAQHNLRKAFLPSKG